MAPHPRPTAAGWPGSWSRSGGGRAQNPSSLSMPGTNGARARCSSPTLETGGVISRQPAGRSPRRGGGGWARGGMADHRRGGGARCHRFRLANRAPGPDFGGMSDFASSRVTAVLGPTNTGKTYLAVERMLGHRTGMIGFPLRLLARENYDRIRKIKGDQAV